MSPSRDRGLYSSTVLNKVHVASTIPSTHLGAFATPPLPAPLRPPDTGNLLLLAGGLGQCARYLLTEAQYKFTLSNFSVTVDLGPGNILPLQLALEHCQYRVHERCRRKEIQHLVLTGSCSTQALEPERGDGDHVTGAEYVGSGLIIWEAEPVVRFSSSKICLSYLPSKSDFTGCLAIDMSIEP